MVKVQIDRGVVVDFGTLAPKSIALDGYVQGPAVDVEARKFSFDHHDGCIRLMTRATCEQVLDSLILGLELEGMTAYVNDVDGDTVLAVWLLQNPERALEAQVRELIACVGGIDAHGPAYVAANPELATTFFQVVMKPVSDCHRTRSYGTANLEQLLAQCMENVGRLLSGGIAILPQRQIDPVPYEITHTGKNGFVMARADGFIFQSLYEAGHLRAVAYQVLDDGSFAYTVGKKSELISGFPVGPHKTEGTILFALNQREVGWGGGTTIGGAPRNADGSRSRLTPNEVFAIVEAIVG